MKTLESIKSEIAIDRKQAEKEDLTKREAKQIEKRIKKLYACQLYLETDPTETFIQKQKADVSKKIKIINDGFSDWLKNNAKESDGCKNPKSKYQTYMGLKNLKAQYLTLSYLLTK